MDRGEGVVDAKKGRPGASPSEKRVLKVYFLPLETTKVLVTVKVSRGM